MQLTFLRSFLLLICCSFFTYSTSGQLSQDEFDDLVYFSDIAVHAKQAKSRVRGNKAFLNSFNKIVKRPNSFSFQFEQIPFITCLMPPDSSFKLISFNVMDEKDQMTNYCYTIQKDNNHVTKMTPTNYFDDLEYELLDASTWLPALYYHMIPYRFKGEQVYLLFGYAQLDTYEKRKVLDVLYFDQVVPKFGKPLFIKKQEGRRDIEKTRLIFQYSADVALLMQYDEIYKSIVIDHLTKVRSKIPGAMRNVAVPDGTYISYRITEDGLIYNDMLFDENISQPKEDNTKAQKTKSGLFKNKNK